MARGLIVQISQKELVRYGITPQAFAETFAIEMEHERITVPVVLHLDHTNANHARRRGSS
jgi:fructose-bisphosphate aldolase class II